MQCSALFFSPVLGMLLGLVKFNLFSHIHKLFPFLLSDSFKYKLSYLPLLILPIDRRKEVNSCHLQRAIRATPASSSPQAPANFIMDHSVLGCKLILQQQHHLSPLDVIHHHPVHSSSTDHGLFLILAGRLVVLRCPISTRALHSPSTSLVMTTPCWYSRPT